MFFIYNVLLDFLAVNDGRAALVQNLPAGDPKFDIRNAALECAVMDRSGGHLQGQAEKQRGRPGI